MNRLNTSDNIANILSIFSKKIEILSANNELSWHKHAENIMIPLLNIIFGTKLTNSNVGANQQSTAIDLKDENKKISFQITSDDSFTKIKTTLTKFIDKELYKKFDKLSFIFLKEKGRRSLTRSQELDLAKILDNKLKFNTQDDLYDLAKIYSYLSAIPVEEANNLLEHLNIELGNLNEHFKMKAPIITVIFDDKEDLEDMQQIIEGLLQVGIQIRHFSPDLNYKLKLEDKDNGDCQLLYEPSTNSKIVVTLGTSNLKSSLKKANANTLIIETLQNPHNVNYLFKVQEHLTFSDIPKYKPQVFTFLKNYNQFIVDTVVLELQKLNRITEIKGYDDFETIVRLYESKAEFTVPKEGKNSRKKIGYTLLEAIDNLKKHKTYYIYLYRNVSIKPTAEEVFQLNPSLKNKKDAPLIVILPKEPQQKNLDDRIISVKKAFKTDKVFYLDEFIWEHCNINTERATELVKFSVTKNFIAPKIKLVEGTISDFDQIDNWLYSENDPLLVITGGGGIGKTTMAKVIADKFQTTRTNSRVLFIEASDPNVTNGLLRASEGRQIDLYDFYKSSFPQDSINKDLFRINIDNGNFLLIIDGLDEVFSRIPDFNVKNFVTGVITDFVKDIGNGKILITCRSYFWKDILSKDTFINHFEIEPFSRKHAELYFDSKFNNDEKLTKRSLNIIDSFNPKGSNEKDEIMPYLVDVVAKIVESGDELYDQKMDSPKYFDLCFKNDYVIYRLLSREYRKNNQIDIELQCEFFLIFSVFHNGKILSDNLGDIWQLHFKQPITIHIDKALKSHPLIEEHNGLMYFKYDFFDLFFKALYLANILNPESNENPNKNLIKILLNEGRFGSSLFFETSNRTYKEWNEEYIFRISLLLESIPSILVSNPEFSDPKIGHQLISSLFALALMINQQKYDSHISTNTKLLLDLFGRQNNQIHNLSIINFSDSQKKLKFNFTDLTFFESYFEDYEGFWECTFNRTTFEKCSFFNMTNYALSKSSGITLSMFRNCRTDLTFDEYFQILNEKSVDKSKNIKNALDKFLRLFYSAGYLQPQGLDSIIKKRYTSRLNSVVPLELILEVLESQNIIKIEFNKIAKESRINIQEEHKEEIIQFTKEDTMSTKIKKVLEGIEKRI